MEKGRENISAISKLKVAVSQTDALATRLFFERLLSAADFQPPGISRKAIVCIKKIDAPLLKTHFLTNSAADWEKGVRETVDKLLRRAFRPSREAIPAQAVCVVFEDRAEMLACLARDWTRSLLAERWWWRAVFPNLFRGRTAAEIWLEAAQFAPAALQILSQTADARGFVEKLQTPEVSKLLRKLTTIFGLEKLSGALFAPIEKSSALDFKKPQNAPEKAGAEEIPAAATALEDFIAVRLADIKIENLSFERQSLLETALLLARAPRVVRSADFAERVKLRRINHELRKINETAEKLSEAVSEEKRAPEINAAANIETWRKLQIEPRKKRSKFVKAGKPIFSFRADDQEAPENPRTETTGKRGFVEKSPDDPKKAEKAAKRSKLDFKVSPPAKEPGKIDLKGAEKNAEVGKAQNAPPPSREQTFEDFFEERAEAFEDSFQTRLGGVFYLLNLGLFLGLYRDFTESLQSELDLNIWDFTALLSREFIGERIKTDPLWNFLRRAAERESDEDFGREFDHMRDWRVNPDWLETFPKTEKWLFAATSKRLVVRHAAGFNVIDAATRGKVSKSAVERETRPYLEYRSEIIEAGKSRPARLKSKRWLENLAEYLQKRLFQALGARSSKTLNAILFERRATVTVSATHLEITYSLADLPIEVRLAGIDRDPGWIPAAGKFVYFHFV